MLAYPTPTFDAKTILEGPGHRPIGRGASYVFPATASPKSPEGCVNKKAYNSRGFTGSRAEKFIQDNQFLPTKLAPGVNPLSVPGFTGNEFEGGYAGRPTFAEPKNGQMLQMLDVLNNRGDARHGADLSPAQTKFITEQTMKAATPQVGGEQVATDLADTQRAMTKEKRIRNAQAQGFSREEAESAYNKLRDEEAKTALFAQQSLSTRLYDLIDSKLGGSQDGSAPGNDESALYLATRHPDLLPRTGPADIVARKTTRFRPPSYVNEFGEPLLSPALLRKGIAFSARQFTEINPQFMASARNLRGLRAPSDLPRGVAQMAQERPRQVGDVLEIETAGAAGRRLGQLPAGLMRAVPQLRNRGAGRPRRDAYHAEVAAPFPRPPTQAQREMARARA
jgi:hypothetical protein